MCNCGKKRISSRDSIANTKKEIPAQPGNPVRFEYIGKTALTVIGNVTRKQYRFNYPGDKQNIDYRDLKAIMNIRVLKNAEV
ncbi:MAG TPA: hypothetical protein VH396_09055 [Chitinophagaceae bacterium]|jgi:hypothetical protein